MRVLLRVGIFVVVISLLLLLGRNIIIKGTLEKGVAAMTGLKLSMGHLDIGLFQPYIQITDFKLYNPDGYEDSVMLDIPEVYIQYNLPAIIKRDVHLSRLKINLKEFLVVKNDKNELNLNSLKALSKTNDSKETRKREAARQAVRIDQLDLKIGHVVYKDYSKGQPPYIKKFPINIDNTYKNISNLNNLVRLIVVKALTKTTIASLTDINLERLSRTLGESLKSAPKGVSTTAMKVLKATSEKTKEAAGTAAGVLRDLTESVKSPLQK